MYVKLNEDLRQQSMLDSRESTQTSCIANMGIPRSILGGE